MKRRDLAELLARPEAIAHERRRRLLTRDFAAFVRAAWHVVEPEDELTWGWHLEAICRSRTFSAHETTIS